MDRIVRAAQGVRAAQTDRMALAAHGVRVLGDPNGPVLGDQRVPRSYLSRL